MNLLSKDEIFEQEKLANENIKNGNFFEAEKIFKNLIKTNIQNQAYYNDLGNVQKEQGKIIEAKISYKKGLELNPNNSRILINLGSVLKIEGSLNEAINSIKKGIQLGPDKMTLVIALNNLGNIYKQKRELEEALNYYQKAIKLEPNYLLSHFNMGNLYEELGDIDSAISSHSNVLKINKKFYFSFCKIITLKRYICDWKDFYQTFENCKIDKTFLSGFLPRDTFFIFDDPSIDLEVAQKYCLNMYPKNSRKLTIKKKHKIRIGYFSADFRYHPVSILLAKVLELHDREVFEVYVYSFNCTGEDFYTHRIKKVVDHYFDINSLNNDQIFNLVRSHDIDIAVDLMGYTEFARTSLFAQRIAPIQINYLGFSGSMGAKFMDYIIADKTLIKENEKKFYSEKILFLKKTAICFDHTLKKTFSQKNLKREFPPNHFVFVCFNHNYKISPDEFKIWLNLLCKIQKSYLWLKASNEKAKNNLLEEARKRGISSDRIVFAKYVEFDQHLTRHSQGDLFLDTFNYNSGSTGVISLLSGLPLLTLYGNCYHSRMSSSILKSLDLDELIAYDKDEYQEKAFFLATNPEEIKKIKDKLADKLKDPVYFNSSIFTKELESKYKTIYLENQ